MRGHSKRVSDGGGESIRPPRDEEPSTDQAYCHNLAYDEGGLRTAHPSVTMGEEDGLSRRKPTVALKG